MNMTWFVVVGAVAVTLLVQCPAQAQELKKISLDDVSALGLSVQADAGIKTEGSASIRITTAWPTTVCLGEVSGLDVENAQLVFKAKVKTDLEGDAFLEMWVQVGGGNYFSKGMNDPAKGKSDGRPSKPNFNSRKARSPTTSHSTS